MPEKNKTRILYLRTDIGTQDLRGGGSVAHTQGILKGFLSLGAYVFCASTAMHGVLQQMSLPFLPLAVPRFLQHASFKMNCLLSNIFFYFKLKRCIQEHRITMIYQRYSMLNCLGVALAQRFNVPLYLEYNGSECWVDQHWSPKRRLKIDRLIEKVELFNLQHASKIIVVSQVLKEQLLARGIDENKIQVCPNGVDPDKFDLIKMQTSRELLRAQYNLTERFVFGFSGTFGPWHGIDVLAYMIPRVVHQNARAHFLLIGDGPLKQMLYDALAQAQVLHYVTFTGMVEAASVPDYLAMCDAFLCPTQNNADGSRFFGSPTKLFEYMMIGKPIIASDVEQIGQILGATGTSLLVRPGDFEGFVHKAMSLFDISHEDLVRIEQAMQRPAQEKYTWKSRVQSFM